MAQDTVSVKFRRRHKSYNAGEIAGFRVDVARDLFVRMIAEPVDGDWRGVIVPRLGVAPKGAAEGAEAAQGEADGADADEGGSSSPEGVDEASAAAGQPDGEIPADAAPEVLLAATVPDVVKWAKRDDVEAEALEAVYEAEIARTDRAPRGGVLEPVSAEISRRREATPGG